jgi:hypothetical protein
VPNQAEVSRVRRFAASAAFASVSGAMAYAAFESWRGGWGDWHMWALAGLLGVAAVGLSRRSLLVQALSRGMAWLAFAPLAIVTFYAVLHGSIEPEVAALTATSGAALLLGRPMLHTKEARAEFSPVRFRRWLLSGTTAAAAAGITTSAFALEAFERGHLAASAGLGLFATALAGSAFGVLRMRAWGILLGGLTSLLALGGALVSHSEASLAWLMAALPGLLLMTPVLASKLGSDKAQVTSPANLRVAEAAEASQTRIRVDIDEDLAAVEEPLPPKAVARVSG